MARHLNLRHRICTVRSSLIPEANPGLSAFNFATYSNMVPEETFKTCGMEKSLAARMVEAQTCPADIGVPWDVALRRLLRVVEPRDLSGAHGERLAEGVGG